jgi:anion-transporting  ArsA/GET3 family ATPase
VRRRRTEVVPPLQIVTGKGGVGKSTFAAALALAAARSGHEVLAIEMGEPGGLAGVLDVRPRLHGIPVAVEPRLHVAYYDGEAALAEYLTRFLPWKALIQSVVSHPLYRAFVSAGPGVRELMAIGKVRDELLGLSAGRPLWDLVVVDAGASGHALQLLGMAAATARTFQSGLAHREAARVARVLADPTRTAVHVVALPEEMPLQEAGEVIEKLRDEPRLPVGRLIVNQCLMPAPQGAAEAAALLQPLDGDPAQRSLATAVRRTLGWLRLQEGGIAALERRVGLRAERLPRLYPDRFGRAEIERLASALRLASP